MGGGGNCLRVFVTLYYNRVLGPRKSRSIFRSRDDGRGFSMGLIDFVIALAGEIVYTGKFFEEDEGQGVEGGGKAPINVVGFSPRRTFFGKNSYFKSAGRRRRSFATFPPRDDNVELEILSSEIIF